MQKTYNKNRRELALLLSVLIGAGSLFLTYDSFTRFNVNSSTIGYHITNPFFLHSMFVCFILLLSVPAIAINLKLLQVNQSKEKTNAFDEGHSHTLDDSNQRIKSHRMLKQLYLTYSLAVLVHPFIILLIILSVNATVNSPLIAALIIILNLAIGIFSTIDAARLQSSKNS